MPHLSKQEIKPEVKKVLQDQLLTFLSAASTKKEAKVLAEELLSETEQLMLGKRLAVVVMLARGYSYSEIKGLLGVTSQTVNRIAQEVRSGKCNKLTRYARNYTEHFKKTTFWDGLEKILSAGLPPRVGKGRWKNLYKSLDA
jgi:uncharacterized protein YerC